jgi:hypothetical protein
MSWVRTCSWARQILLWARWLTIGLAVASRRKRLAICAIHGRRLADTAPDGVGGHKSLRLCRNGSEDAVLVEPHAVGAAAVLCRLETRASNLAASAVPAGNGSALAGSWRLVVLLDILRWWRRLLSIWVWRRRSTRPFIGAWQTVRLRVLVLVLRMLGHVGSRLLGRRRRERGVHMGRRRIRAIRGLLRGRRLPVSGKLALATLMRKHCSVTGVGGGSGGGDGGGGRKCVGEREGVGRPIR